MQIIIHTNSGKAEPLFAAINKKIKDGDLKTWEIKKDSDGNYHYNHIPEQWSDKAMLQPFSHADGLRLNISWWTTKGEPDEAIKGYIIGRFTEILMVHFKDKFEHLEVK